MRLRKLGAVATLLLMVVAILVALAQTMARMAHPNGLRKMNRVQRRSLWRQVTRGLAETYRRAYWTVVLKGHGIHAVPAGATNALSAFGTTISWNGTTVAQIKNISGPGLKAALINVTAHDSSSAFEEFVAGLRDGGEVSIDGQLYTGDTNGQIAMVTDCAAGTMRQAIITGPAAAAYTWTFNAIITAIDFGQPHDKELSFSAKLKITGSPTLAVTTSANLTTLTGIEENAGAALTFAPVFAGGTYAYMVTVNAASTWIKLTPTLAGATITITQDSDTNSQTVASGAQSGTIALTNGAVTKVTVSVKETGKIPKIYTVYVYNA